MRRVVLHGGQDHAGRTFPARLGAAAASKDRADTREHRADFISLPGSRQLSCQEVGPSLSTTSRVSARPRSKPPGTRKRPDQNIKTNDIQHRALRPAVRTVSPAACTHCTVSGIGLRHSAHFEPVPSFIWNARKRIHGGVSTKDGMMTWECHSSGAPEVLCTL